MKRSLYGVMGILTLFFVLSTRASELAWFSEIDDTFLRENGLGLEDIFGDDQFTFPELPENKELMDSSFDESVQLQKKSEVQNQDSLFASSLKAFLKEEKEKEKDRKNRNNISAQKSKFVQETIIKRKETHPNLFQHACAIKLKRDPKSDQLIAETNKVIVALKKQLQHEKGHTIKASNALCERLIAQVEKMLAQNSFSTENLSFKSHELFQKAPCLERVKKVMKASSKARKRENRDSAARARERKQKLMAAILKKQTDKKE